ncbi:MAG: hypothetical protein ACMG6E_03270 [Candidatus Roizmanbacteria bacterium]
MTEKCQGYTKQGKPCQKKKPKNGIYCYLHDPEAIKGGSKAKKSDLKVISDLKEEMKHVKLIERKKTNAKAYDMEERDSCARQIIKENVEELALTESGVEIAHIDGAVPFTRKVWMIIGWHLETDINAYVALAMTCKDLWRVLCADKIWYLEHPLKGKFLSPRLYRMPIALVVELKIPHHFDKILQMASLPSIEDVLMTAVDTETKSTAEQIMGDVILSLYETMIKAKCAKWVDEEFIEEIEGAGVMTYYKGKNPVEFTKNPGKHRIEQVNGHSWIIMHSQNEQDFRKARRKFAKYLVGFDGKRVIRLKNH